MGKIRKSGGYRKLATFQTSTIIYDATVWFCEKETGAKRDGVSIFNIDDE